MVRRLKPAVLMFALFASAGLSRADVLSGCGTCQGGSYLLQYETTPVGTYAGGGKIYNVFFSIDTTKLNLASATNVGAVSVKISSGVDNPPSTLVSAPGGASNWTVVLGGISAGGCSGSGAGFICAKDPLPNNATLPHTGTYTWQFQYGTTKALLLGNLASVIKVQYVNAAGTKVGDLVSEGITLQSCLGDCGRFPVGDQVPEPSSVVLLGSLVSYVGVQLRRRFRNS